MNFAQMLPHAAARPQAPARRGAALTLFQAFVIACSVVTAGALGGAVAGAIGGPSAAAVAGAAGGIVAGAIAAYPVGRGRR